MQEINEPQKELDFDQAIIYLEKAVGEKGRDYIYEIDGVDAITYRNQSHGIAMPCHYWHKGAPSCIVGHVLDYMGYEPEQIVGLHHVNCIEGNTAAHALGLLGIDADPETQALLHKVQELQDRGVPWGEALDRVRGLGQ